MLRPGGRLVLVSLTEGVDLPSQLFVAGWKLAYRLDPRRLGGCRPLQLAGMLGAAGFAVERRMVVQGGFPSEVLVGTKPRWRRSALRGGRAPWRLGLCGACPAVAQIGGQFSPQPR